MKTSCHDDGTAGSGLSVDGILVVAAMSLTLLAIRLLRRRAPARLKMIW
jgi:hypothetical protein